MSHLHLCELAFQLCYAGISGQTPLPVRGPEGCPLLQGLGVLDAAHLSLQRCQSICRGAFTVTLRKTQTANVIQSWV